MYERHKGETVIYIISNTMLRGKGGSVVRGGIKFKGRFRGFFFKCKEKREMHKKRCRKSQNCIKNGSKNVQNNPQIGFI